MAPPVCRSNCKGLRLRFAARYRLRKGWEAVREPLLIGMRPPFRSKQAVIIDVPLATVWEFSMDITRIPAYHPRVVKVALLSGKARREPGVSYQCYLSGGKHTCVEKDIEILPMQKIVTVLAPFRQRRQRRIRSE